MTLKIGHLGPTGTYSEAAALAYARAKLAGVESCLQPYPNIAQTLKAVAAKEVALAIVPVENSIEGGVTMTADTIWQLVASLQIQQAIVLPIHHALVSVAEDLSHIETVYSHPQALSQCQLWLQQHLPQAVRIADNSTTAALATLAANPQAAAISSVRAANLYQLPVLVRSINDYPDNQTKFWAISLQPTLAGNRTSVAFSLRSNTPGGLVTALGFFANRGLNLSRVESRPSKRSLGDYLFFIDIETDRYNCRQLKSALADLDAYAETVKNFGSYDTTIIEVL
ncbi:prephenate dehydratase [Chamaesiphon minutus]|uniref:Prephenate dehydratase n=1 Tax=Chamaesiphon minutus (strain ATCC 27169 / PCC 6605) TaxID=1173020 RepID=K9UKS4_CHAP6|nr:prephenate dehydratase [Chamaesiphon minutus]AFY94769.1 prephenate dehydratase [Chamaesiphon minutus PCC 6605]